MYYDVDNAVRMRNILLHRTVIELCCYGKYSRVFFSVLRQNEHLISIKRNDNFSEKKKIFIRNKKR